jgi:hypothetical protein
MESPSLERRDGGEAGGGDVALEAGRSTTACNPAAHAVAANDADEPNEQYWVIKAELGLVHDLRLSEYKSAPLGQNATQIQSANLIEKNRATARTA